MTTSDLYELNENAGQKLWRIQCEQETHLCCGLDPHYSEGTPLNEAFYGQFESNVYDDEITAILEAHRILGPDPARVCIFISGVINYLCRVALFQWECGVRVHKPQASFYEAFAPFGEYILSEVVKELDALASPTELPTEDADVATEIREPPTGFKIGDLKRGDIMSTQERYYAAYLTGRDEELFAGIGGQYAFDAMTVTTWMGEDVLTPGLPWFRRGHGAVVVTRSSNPSGTTLQDVLVEEPLGEDERVELSDKQEPFRLKQSVIVDVATELKRMPTAHDVMLYLTECFCRKHELIDDGISPIFSVMGATTRMTDAFRILRPSGTALIPGFGAQGGNFANVMPFVKRDGPRTGQLGICSSSRGHLYPWLKKYGGQGNPQNLRFEVERSIDAFRKAERAAYKKAGLPWPF